jgi:hypothetical protein
MIRTVTTLVRSTQPALPAAAATRVPFTAVRSLSSLDKKKVSCEAACGKASVCLFFT